MAKGTAFCTCAKCGKTFKMEATKFNRREADEWEAWATANYDECSDCYKERKAAERVAKNAAAADSAKAQNLPELTGSVKQIAWAETIRQQRLEEVAKMMPSREDWQKHHADFWVWLIEHTTSAWWIDRRPSYYPCFVDNAVREFSSDTGWTPEQTAD